MGFLLDLESGAELTQTATDVRTVRVATVDELEGSDLDAMLWDALVVLANLGTTDPPLTDIVIGAAHPTIPGIVVLALDAFPMPDCARARVEITYGIAPVAYVPPAGADGVDHKTIRFLNVPKKVTRDPKDGTTELIVSPPPAYSNRDDQTKEIVYNESRELIVFTRAERTAPTARGRTYKNKVNSIGLGTGAYPPGTLYLGEIQADTRDQGGLYVVRYQFEYDENGHEQEYKWEHRGLEVPAYDAGSRKQIVPYKSIDFTPLGLNFDD